MKQTNNPLVKLFFSILVLLGAQQAGAQYAKSSIVRHMKEVGGWTESTDHRYAYLKEGQSTTGWYRTFLPD